MNLQSFRWWVMSRISLFVQATDMPFASGSLARARRGYLGFILLPPIVSAALHAAQSEFAIRAPTRIDFGGGWTDVPPYDIEQGGFVCNVAITRYATVRVRPAPNVNSAELAVVRPGDIALLQAAPPPSRIPGAAPALTSDFSLRARLGGIVA